MPATKKRTKRAAKTEDRNPVQTSSTEEDFRKTIRDIFKKLFRAHPWVPFLFIELDSKKLTGKSFEKLDEFAGLFAEKISSTLIDSSFLSKLKSFVQKYDYKKNIEPYLKFSLKEIEEISKSEVKFDNEIVEIILNIIYQRKKDPNFFRPSTWPTTVKQEKKQTKKSLYKYKK